MVSRSFVQKHWNVTVYDKEAKEVKQVFINSFDTDEIVLKENQLLLEKELLNETTVKFELSISDFIKYGTPVVVETPIEIEECEVK